MKRLIVKALLLLVLLYSRTIPGTGSYFTDSDTLSFGTISTGEWSTPEVSTRITTNYDQDFGYESLTTNFRTLTINYSQTPPSLPGVQVRLCYSFNLDDFDCSNAAYTASTGHFDFDFPRGNGLYVFETRALQNNNFIEDKELDLLKNGMSYYLTILRDDSTPPNSNLSVGTSKVYTGQSFASTSSATLSGNSSFYQIVSLPSHITSQLSFWFNMTANDPADLDRFDVTILNPADDLPIATILSTGSNELSSANSWNHNSGWQQIIHPLYDFANRSIKILFSLINNNDAYSGADPVVELKDINVSTIDLRLGDTGPVDVVSHDTGSGVNTQTFDPSLQVGDNTVDFSANDVAGNQETDQSVQISVLPPVVLNKINFHSSTSDSIDLYNNTSSLQTLTGWYFQNSIGTTTPITDTIIAPNSLVTVNSLLLNDMTDTIMLFNPSSPTPVDTTTYVGDDNEDELWMRTPDGVGTWALKSPLLSSHLTYSPATHRLLLTISNINSNPVEYSIGYTGNGQPQEIAGTISPATIVDNKTDREFYLGTCSQSVCTPESVPVLEFSLNVNGVTKTYHF